MPSKKDLAVLTICLLILEQIGKKKKNVNRLQDCPLSLLMGGLTENSARAAKRSNRLIQILSQTRFPSNTVKFELNVKSLQQGQNV